jgi:hypothetical protein
VGRRLCEQEGIAMSCLSFLDKIPGAAYALLGVLFGGWITWRYQHKQWVLDNKKQEYRDLIDGLFQASEEIVKARPNISAVVGEELLNAVWKGQRVVRNRIFVARQIREERIEEDWDTIRRLALWEPEEDKLEIKGKKYSYAINVIVMLRNELDKKLLAIAQRDLRL